MGSWLRRISVARGPGVGRVLWVFALFAAWAGCATAVPSREACLRRALSSERPKEARNVCRGLFPSRPPDQREPAPVLPSAVEKALLFVQDQGLCRVTSFDARGQLGTVTGCRRESSSFELVDGQLVHTCVSEGFDPIRHRVTIEPDALVLDDGRGPTLFRTRAACFASLTEAPEGLDPCCTCLATQHRHGNACLEDTVSSCASRLDAAGKERAPRPANARLALKEAESTCISFMCQDVCPE
jgi:hypothetical protein